MRITCVSTDKISLPLRRPFVTALRTVYALENVRVDVYTDTGEVGYGEAPTAAAVTGETFASVRYAVEEVIAPRVTGLDVEDEDALSRLIEEALPYNTSAKAAVEAALFNLRTASPPRRLSLPPNNLTVSAGSAEAMTADGLQALDRGFSLLKVKLGKDAARDAETLLFMARTLREQRPGQAFTFRVDANGGWRVKEALRVIHMWEDAGAPVAWVEQPNARWDVDGLAEITRRTVFPIMADEAVFSPRDALRVCEKRAADWINIKLAKAGGPRGARDIAAICRTYGLPWMMGCMLESRLAVSVAAQCASDWGADAIDLDGPLLCEADAYAGGPMFEGAAVLGGTTPLTLV